MLLTCILSVHHNSHWCTKTFATKDFFLKNTKATDIGKSIFWRKKTNEMCYLQSILSVHCPPSKIFLYLCIYQLLSWVNKRVFNFYNEDIFPPRGKKLNNIYHGVRCQQQRSLKLRTKFTMDTYLVRSAQHNWQFMNRTLGLCFGKYCRRCYVIWSSQSLIDQRYSFQLKIWKNLHFIWGREMLQDPKYILALGA